MAPESRRTAASVSEQLFREPYRFDFFQAVRLLETLARAGRHPVGGDWAPAQEVVRFRALPGLSFPPAAITQLRDRESTAPPDMVVAFLGLTGPSGVLPTHYTSLLLQRLRLKDYSLRDFLDLFNHRIVSLFYRAWEKYRLPVAYERARRAEPSGEPDSFTFGLNSLVGLGTGRLRRRQQVPDEAILFYGGLFARQPRCAVSLERMLTEYLGVPVAVQQFHGQWLYLGEDDRTRLGGPESPQAGNSQLGVDAVVGGRVWDVQSKLRLRVGPMNYDRFTALLPAGRSRTVLAQMVRLYLGPDLDFDVQLVLVPLEAPWCQLTCDEDAGRRLGLDAWVRTHDFDEAVDDAVNDGDDAGAAFR